MFWVLHYNEDYGAIENHLCRKDTAFSFIAVVTVAVVTPTTATYITSVGGVEPRCPSPTVVDKKTRDPENTTACTP